MFEGADGTGKTRQAQALFRRLKQLPLEVMVVAEPGGTPLGSYVRALVTGQQGLVVLPSTTPATAAPAQQLFSDKIQLPLSPEAELFLFAASRAQLVRDVIRPNLERGAVVIADRYAPSTMAYQGYGRGLPKALVRRVNDLATGGIWPDLIVLLDVPEPVSQARRKRRRKEDDRFEREVLAFHRKVRRGYQSMAAHDPGRWLVIKGDRPARVVQNEVWRGVSPLLVRRKPSLGPLLGPGGKPEPAATRPEGQVLKLDL